MISQYFESDFRSFLNVMFKYFWRTSWDKKISRINWAVMQYLRTVSQSPDDIFEPWNKDSLQLIKNKMLYVIKV